MENNTLEMLVEIFGSLALGFASLNLLAYHITSKVAGRFAEDYGIDSTKKLAREKIEYIRSRGRISRTLIFTGVEMGYERFLSRFSHKEPL